MLPILHLNGFKISERTVFGCMDEREITALFVGYGYQPRFVDSLDDIDTDLHTSMVWAVSEIRKIQNAARKGRPIDKPRWPVLILRTPKVGNPQNIYHKSFLLTVNRDGQDQRKSMGSSLKDPSILTRSRYPRPRKTRKSFRHFKPGFPRTGQTKSSTAMAAPLRKSNRSSLVTRKNALASGPSPTAATTSSTCQTGSRWQWSRAGTRAR